MWGTCGKKAKPFINNSLVLNIVILLGLFQDPMRFGHSMKECEKHNENEEKKTRMTLSLSFSFCFCDPKVEKSNFYRDLERVRRVPFTVEKRVKGKKDNFYLMMN